MALPGTEEARIFYQAALQRFKDAELLMDGIRTTGAVYLAGYSVECILKALILSLTPERKHKKVVDSFRGAKAHDFEWLKHEYLVRGGAPFPAGIARLFALVYTWTTTIRYRPGAVKEEDARTFVNATDEILLWADGRL